MRFERTLVGAAMTAMCFAPAMAAAAPVTIEPDDYADGTALRNVSPLVTLRVATSNFGTYEPDDFFAITSEDGDSLGTDYSPTGTRVFGHDGIRFIDAGFRLWAEFGQPTDSAGFLFQGTSSLSAQVGRLEAYSAAGTLLTFVETAPQFISVAPLAITRPTADIAYVVAYTSSGSFGQFDALTFNAVPEPAGLAAAAVALSGVLRRRRGR